MLRPTVFNRSAILCRGSIITKRKYVIQQTIKGIKGKIDEVGDEESQASKKTISILRKIGVGSIVVVLCLLGYAALNEKPKIEEKEEELDLSKDIRSESTN